MYLPADAEDMSTMLQHTTATRNPKLISPQVEFLQSAYRVSSHCTKPRLPNHFCSRRCVGNFLDSIFVEVRQAENDAQLDRAAKATNRYGNAIPLLVTIQCREPILMRNGGGPNRDEHITLLQASSLGRRVRRQRTKTERLAIITVNDNSGRVRLRCRSLT